MEILLDTHTLIWWASGHAALSRKVQRLIQDDETRTWVSAASAWEIATKVRMGKLKWPSSETLQSYCLTQKFELLPVTFAHGERAGSWPQPHADPFDRMLAAQSNMEGITLATNDPRMALFGIETIW